MIDVVPFEMPSPIIPFVVVEAVVNGDQPAKVLLDTGAAAPFAVIVSPALAKRSGAPTADGPVVASTGAVGPIPVNFRKTRLKTFALGSVKLAQIDAGVTPALEAVSKQIGTQIDAIIGQEFARGRTIAIDYRHQTVNFSASAGPPETAISFELAPIRPLALVSVHLNGSGPFRFALDTAASASVISPETAKAAKVTGGYKVSLGGAGGLAATGAAMAQARIAVGSLSKEGQNMVVADMLGPIQVASGAKIDGVLGANFLKGSKMTIDYSTRRLWIEWQAR